MARRRISRKRVSLPTSLPLADVSPSPQNGIAITNFAGGINWRDAPHLLQDNEARDLVDAVIEELGSLSTRGGTERWNTTPLSDTATCYGLFRYKGNPSCFLVVLDGTIYKGDDTTKSFSQLATGFQNDFWFGIQVQVDNYNFLFLANKLDRPRKFDGTNLYLLGVDAPSSAPTLAYNATGQIPAGTYYYRISYVGEGCESSLGPPASITTTQTGSIDLSNIPSSSDPQVSKKRIYRSKANDASAFYFLAEIDNTVTTYNDNTLDSSLGEMAVLYRNPPPAQVSTLAWHKGRLWTNDLQNPNYVWFSRPWEPQSFDPQNYVKLPITQEDSVVALRPLGDNLIVYCAHSIWMITGSFEQEFVPVRTYAQRGCFAHRSIAEALNVHFYIAPNGIYQFAGSEIQEITGKIPNFFKFIDMDYLKNTQLVVYPHPRQFLLLFPFKEKPSSLEADRRGVLVFDLRYQAWLRWELPMEAIVLDENGELYFWRRKSGILYHYSPDIHTDEAVDGTKSPVRLTWLSKQYSFPEGTFTVKQIRRVGLVGRLTEGSYSLTVITDGGKGKSHTFYFSSQFHPAYYGEAKYGESYYGFEGPVKYPQSAPMDLIGSIFQFVLTAASQYPISITEIDVIYKVKPYRWEVGIQ